MSAWARIPLAAWAPLAAVLFAGCLGLRSGWRRLGGSAQFGCALLGMVLVYAGLACGAWVAGALWLSCLVASVFPLLLLVAGIRWAFGRGEARRLAGLDEAWTAAERAMLDGQSGLPR